jgi:hypothetical protein
MTNNRIPAFAGRLEKLSDDYKTARADLIAEAKEADVDPGALLRLVARLRKSEQERLEQDALDYQYQFLAGLRPEGAQMPTRGELEAAAALYAQNLPVRAVAKKMGISTGKAHKLKLKASAFTVQPQVNMNAPQEMADGHGATPPAAQRAAAREEKTEKEQPVEDDSLEIPRFLRRRSSRPAP